MPGLFAKLNPTTLCPPADEFTVTFSLTSGQVRRYKRLCELIQSMIMAPGHVTSTNVVIGRKISRELASDASELSMDKVNDSSSCSSAAATVVATLTATSNVTSNQAAVVLQHRASHMDPAMQIHTIPGIGLSTEVCRGGWSLLFIHPSICLVCNLFSL